ncbi:YwiC-like family protein [Brockia lithotrophica]|uniref:YwiC-like protein n=1 Tax=Brockia lithotrophica TaxID=933949 RepID=A0A660KTY0_9BACL|nr:YwiC-like family protein [Brockia lithotrophica]RKQ84165.1 YwiC-like protein [Brockia lithotrophica]
MASSSLPVRAYIPREHGAWFMFFVPLVVGFVRFPSAWNVSLAFGLGLLFLSAGGWLRYLRSRFREEHALVWGGVLAGAGILFLLPPLIHVPVLYGFLAIGILSALVYAWEVLRGREKAMPAYVALAFLLSLPYPLLATSGAGTLTADAWHGYFLFAALTVGSSLYVKSLLRERRNPTYAWASHAYHVAVPLVFALIRPTYALLFLPALARDLGTPRSQKITPAFVGVIEIANFLAFGILFLLFL